MGTLLKRVSDFAVTILLHRFLIPVFLALTYCIVFGLGRLLMTVFARGLLKPKFAEGTYWVPATGYEADPGKALRQS